MVNLDPEIAIEPIDSQTGRFHASKRLPAGDVLRAQVIQLNGVETAVCKRYEMTVTIARMFSWVDIEPDVINLMAKELKWERDSFKTSPVSRQVTADDLAQAMGN